MNDLTPVLNIEQVQERLSFYNNKLNEYDEEEQQDWQVRNYIKERIGFWKTELLKAEEKEFFGHLNKMFGIE